MLWIKSNFTFVPPARKNFHFRFHSIFANLFNETYYNFIIHYAARLLASFVPLKLIKKQREAVKNCRKLWRRELSQLAFVCAHSRNQNKEASAWKENPYSALPSIDDQRNLIKRNGSNDSTLHDSHNRTESFVIRFDCVRNSLSVEFNLCCYKCRTLNHYREGYFCLKISCLHFGDFVEWRCINHKKGETNDTVRASARVFTTESKL